MIYSLTILFIACLGMLAMVLVKLHELKTGREFVLVRWRNKVDRYAHLSFSKTKLFIVRKEHQAVLFFKALPGKVLHAVSNLNDFLHRKYGKHIDMIKGKGAPVNKGSVSFFVSAISEYKKEIRQ